MTGSSYSVVNNIEFISQKTTEIAIDESNFNADFISFDSTGMLIDGLNALGLNLKKKNFPMLTEN